MKVTDISSTEMDEFLEEEILKEGNVTSDDGKITLYYKGVGNYTDIKINCFLEETSNRELEKDILEVLLKSRESFSLNFMEDLKKLIEKNIDEEDKDEVTIKDVS